MRDYAVAEIDGKDVMRSDIERNDAACRTAWFRKEATSADILREKAILDSTAIQAEP